ncbi:MAG: hypothetical protein IKD15_01975 [Clostridia bacterium]|nr:hypothetical protein [Clostridia bacterium]
MAKKRGYELLAALAFLLLTVHAIFNIEQVWFGVVRIALYAVMALLMLLPRVKKLTALPLILLVVIECICIIPYSYKLIHNLNLYTYQVLPSWWDERMISSCLAKMYSGANVPAFETWKVFLGIGSMNWLHLDCISAFIGVLALLWLTKVAFSKGKKVRNASNVFMIILLICSGFNPLACVAYYLTFCAFTQEV